MKTDHQLVIDVLEGLKAKDIVSIDIRSLSDLMDCMVVCTGTSSRHVKSVADHLVRRVKIAGMQVFGYEGLDDAQWVLVDIGDIVVHIMLQEIRDYYQVERLWQPFAEKQFDAPSADGSASSKDSRNEL